VAAVIYLYWYLGAGTILMVIALAIAPLTIDKNPSRSNLPVWLIALAVIWIAFALFWPALTMAPIYFRRCGRSDSEAAKAIEFAVTHNDLGMQMSIRKIEVQEMIFDPLGAVPNLPFGHLNSSWMKFREGMQADESLWSFTAHRTDTWGRREVREGYVHVDGGTVGRYFMTVWKNLEDEAESRKRLMWPQERSDIPAWLRRQAD